MKSSAATEGRSQTGLIDRPNDTVTIDVGSPLPGRIICKVLVISPSVKLDAVIMAQKVFIHGEVTGLVRASVVTIGETGKLLGEVHAELFNLAGRFNGVLRSRKVVARDGSRLDGEVIADVLARQDHASLQAQCAVFPGATAREDLVAAARRRVTGEPEPVVSSPPAVVPQTTTDLSSRRLARSDAAAPASISNLVAAAPSEGQRPYLI